METISVSGLRIAYERAGHGPPLVLLHGYVADGPTTWRQQIDALSDEFTVVAWDAPGAGASSDPPESFGMAGYADCLAEFIRALRLEQPHVAGLSFGGALAIEFSRRHAAMPKSLILASAYAGWRGSLPADEAERRLRQALKLADLSPAECVQALLPTMFASGMPPEFGEAFGASIARFHRAGFRAMAHASSEDLSDALSQISIPTLLVYGDRDRRAPLTVAEGLRARLPTSTLVVLPDTGHVCNVESAQAFNEVVRDFLRGHSS